MNAKQKKLKLDISGRFQKLWTELFLKRKAKSLGLALHNVKHHSMDKSEMTVSGDTVTLWKFVKSSKKPVFFVKLEKIEFRFVD